MDYIPTRRTWTLSGGIYWNMQEFLYHLTAGLVYMGIYITIINQPVSKPHIYKGFIMRRDFPGAAGTCTSVLSICEISIKS